MSVWVRPFTFNAIKVATLQTYRDEYQNRLEIVLMIASCLKVQWHCVACFLGRCQNSPVKAS